MLNSPERAHPLPLAPESLSYPWPAGSAVAWAPPEQHWRLLGSPGASGQAALPSEARRCPELAEAPRARLPARRARARPRAHARAFAEGPGSEAQAWAWVAQVGLGGTGAPEKREVDFPWLRKEEREKERRVREREKKRERGAAAGSQLSSETGTFPW